MFNYFIYILAISLQVSVALLLLIKSLSTKKENLLIRFKGSGNIYKDNNTNEISYDKEAFKKVYENTLINRWSFGFIFSGYLIGVFGSVENNCNKCKVIAFASILLLTIMFTVITKFYIEKYAKKHCFEITKEDFAEAKIEADMQSIPNNEIDDLFE
ncbi:MAG: hypothetical protein K6C97_11960 [Treponema sp.]|nr:hypothetical protein [Treponema sp.]